PRMASTSNFPLASVIPPVILSGFSTLCRTKVAYSNGSLVSRSKTVPVIFKDACGGCGAWGACGHAVIDSGNIVMGMNFLILVFRFFLFLLLFFLYFFESIFL